MLKAKIIGIGAAGNKAAINLIEKGVVTSKDVILLNSTIRDVPIDYHDIYVQFNNSIGGCGKERSIARDLAVSSIQAEKLNLDSFMDPDDNMVIIVNSSEGGTGCGASTVIADYMKNVVKTNVHMFVFTGFEDDVRGLANTVEYFKELESSYTVQAISNKKFLDNTGNYSKAEKAANDEFARRIKILLGQIVDNSEQNIDETDLYKTSTTPGFMMIEYATLEKVKNIETFNKVVSDMIDNTKSLDVEKGVARIGVILNISDKTADAIDYSFTVIKDKFGVPYEVFKHTQNTGGTEYIATIISGLKMPLADIETVYENYKLKSSKVNKDKDDFFNFTSKLAGNEEDKVFDMAKKDTGKTIAADKSAFFNKFGNKTPNTKVEETKETKSTKTIKVNNMDKF